MDLASLNVPSLTMHVHENRTKLKSFIAYMQRNILFLLYFICVLTARDENGYDLWLRYKAVENKTLLQSYRTNITAIMVSASSPTMTIAKKEMTTAFSGLLQKNIKESNALNLDGTVIAGTPANTPLINNAGLSALLQQAGEEGFVIVTQIVNGKKCILISANTDIGVLYGTFHFLRLLQTEQSIQQLRIVSSPKIKLR